MDSQDLLALALKYKVYHSYPGYIVCRSDDNLVLVYKEDGTYIGDKITPMMILAALRHKVTITRLENEKST